MNSSVVTKADLEAKYGGKPNASESSGDPSQAEILSDIASQNELFHSPDGTAYADVVVRSHRETWPIRSRRFKRRLCLQFYERTGRALNSDALHSALNLAEAKAQFESPEWKIHVRVAGHHTRPFHGGNGGSTPPGDAIFFNGLQTVDIEESNFPDNFRTISTSPCP